MDFLGFLGIDRWKEKGRRKWKVLTRQGFASRSLTWETRKQNTFLERFSSNEI